MSLDDVEDRPERTGRELLDLRARVERLELELTELRLQVGSRLPLPASSSASAEKPAPPPLILNASPPPTPSMEDRLGSQWFSRIGVLALLIATALALKLAIDKHWLGPVGRIVFGLAIGAGLVLWSERIRRQGVLAFSYALKAIGGGVLYLSLWAAFQLYHLLPAPVALGAMVLVTAWNAFMAWSQEAELLAAYALIGGVATPALLSTGGNHEAFLFTYLSALAFATVVLVRLKHWPRLLLGIFPATVLYFIGWYAEFYAPAYLGLTAAFLVIFGAIFAAASLGFELPDPVAFPLLQSVLLPLANAAFVALGLSSVLQDSRDHAALAWLMVALAAVYLGLMRLPQPRVTAAVHLSLAVVFLTVAIPLKATGRGIIIGWLVEGAVLLWAAARLREVSRPLRWLACAAFALGFAGVISTPFWYSAPSPHPAFLNERFGTALIGLAAFAAAIWTAYHARDTHQDEEEASLAWAQVAAAAVIAFNLIAVWATVREIATFWHSTAFNLDARLQRDLAISAFLMVYSALLLAAGFWRRSAFVRWQGLLLLVFTIAKTFLYDTSSLSQGYRVVSFLALGVLLMGVSFAYQRDWLGLRQPQDGQPPRTKEQQP